MNYRTVRDVNFAGTIIPANRVFQAPEGEESKAIIDRLVSKGSIVEYEGDKSVTETTPEDTTTTQGEGQTTPVVPSTDGGQPTQEQIDAELKAAGVQ